MCALTASATSSTEMLFAGAPTSASSHGGIDDDVAVQDAVIRHVKYPAPIARVQRPAQGPQEDTQAEAPAPPGDEASETETASRLISRAAAARRPRTDRRPPRRR